MIRYSMQFGQSRLLGNKDHVGKAELRRVDDSASKSATADPPKKPWWKFWK